MVKKMRLLLLIVILVVAGILAYRTMQFTSLQVHPPQVKLPPVRPEAFAQLAQAVRLPTISHAAAHRMDTSAFRAFHDFLATAYPLADSVLEKTFINQFSVLYTWKGRNPQLPPMLLLAHLDVVPADSANLNAWAVPPFSGQIDDQFIWGRGTLDDKSNIIAHLEAIELLLAENFTPERNILLAYGHDEEIGGRHGAKAIAALLEKQNIRPALALDEGMILADGVIPGSQRPVALIGVSEKGFLSLELSVNLQSGHSSMPHESTTIGALSGAITRLRAQPFPARLSAPLEGFIAYLGPELPFPQKLLFANRWLFEKLIIKAYEKSAPGNAMVRTTTAPTLFRSGGKDNVLPARGRAVVNFRILPGDTKADVIKRVKTVIADERIAVRPTDAFGSDPSPVADIQAPAFELLATTTRQVFPEAVVAPSLVIGATDARHYTGIAANVYRYMPVILNETDLGRFHGIDERVSKENFTRCIQFYYLFLKNVQEKEL